MPIAVEGTRTALAKHDWRFDYAKARVVVGEPIPTVGLGDEDIDSLMQEARAQIQALRRELRDSLAKESP